MHASRDCTPLARMYTMLSYLSLSLARAQIHVLAAEKGRRQSGRVPGRERRRKEGQKEARKCR